MALTLHHLKELKENMRPFSIEIIIKLKQNWTLQHNNDPNMDDLQKLYKHETSQTFNSWKTDVRKW